VVATELTRLQPGSIFLLGGAVAVDVSVERSLRSFTTGEVIRAAGNDRYATATGAASLAFPAPNPTVFLVSGETFPDALAAAGPAGAAMAPVLPIPPTCQGVGERHLLRRPDVGSGSIYVIGGESALTGGAVVGEPCTADVSGGIWLQTTLGTESAQLDGFCVPGPPFLCGDAGVPPPDDEPSRLGVHPGGLLEVHLDDDGAARTVDVLAIPPTCPCPPTTLVVGASGDPVFATAALTPGPWLIAIEVRYDDGATSDWSAPVEVR
jgi:hypothetical protein